MISVDVEICMENSYFFALVETLGVSVFESSASSFACCIQDSIHSRYRIRSPLIKC
jgi:hypothetical protein